MKENAWFSQFPVSVLDMYSSQDKGAQNMRLEWGVFLSFFIICVRGVTRVWRVKNKFVNSLSFHITLTLGTPLFRIMLPVTTHKLIPLAFSEVSRCYVNSLNRKKINETLEKWAAQGTLLEVVTARDTCLCLGAGVLPPTTVKWVSCFTRYLGFLLYRLRAKL